MGDDHYQTLSGIETLRLNSSSLSNDWAAMIITKPFQGLKHALSPDLLLDVEGGDDHYQTLSGIETFQNIAER